MAHPAGAEAGVGSSGKISLADLGDTLGGTQAMKKKVGVILGAGASADAWNRGGPVPRPEGWRPPLAKDLFRPGERANFWSIMNGFPGVRVLASELGETANTGLEAKLLEYARHPDERMRMHFRQVPLYLRDLILGVTEGYTNNVSPGNHLHLVMRLLSSGHRVVFLDLNYDDYLENALADFDGNLAINTLEDYTNPGREALVGKIHGSIHWGTPAGTPIGTTRQDVIRALCRMDPLRACEELVLDQTRGATTSWRHPRSGHLLYPVLTAPLAGKDHTALVCTRGHLNALREFLEGCEHYLVIGTSGQDEDLLRFLDQSAPPVRAVHYVNYETNATEECQRRVQAGCTAFKNASERVLATEGFGAYLSTKRDAGDERSPVHYSMT